MGDITEKIFVGGFLIAIGEWLYEFFTWFVNGTATVNTLCNTFNIFCYVNTTSWYGLNKILFFLGGISIAFIGLGIFLILAWAYDN